MRNIYLTTAFFLMIKFGNTCNVQDFSNHEENSIYKWLGNKSKFSTSFNTGKCALDKALGELTYSERRVIANLIAKFYKESEKRQRDIETYNY